MLTDQEKIDLLNALDFVVIEPHYTKHLRT